MCPARFPASTSQFEGRAAACSTVIRPVVQRVSRAIFRPRKSQCCPAAPLWMSIGLVGIDEKALLARFIIESTNHRPVSPRNRIPHTVARISFGGQVHDGDRLESHLTSFP